MGVRGLYRGLGFRLKARFLAVLRVLLLEFGLGGFSVLTAFRFPSASSLRA